MRLPPGTPVHKIGRMPKTSEIRQRGVRGCVVLRSGCIFENVILPGVLLVFAVFAQVDTGVGTPIEYGRSYRFKSRILGETRVIDVSVPDRYALDATRRYPVIVVLDGDFEHAIAASIAQFYAGSSQMPEAIVVGVRNTNRSRDLTPEPVAGFERPPEASDGGGAPAFLAFLGNELLPYLDRAYRTAPLRVLVGHSLGGLFAAYALGKRPELFTGYVLMEPSLWWNRGHEADVAREILRQPAGRHARVMLVNVESWGIDTTQWGATRPMVRQITVAGETHSSMAVTGMSRAFRAMFADFKPSPWRPGTRPIAMLDGYDSLTARLGYEVPIPDDAFDVVTRMSLDSRHFDDAQRVLDRWERALGVSAQSREYRQRLANERSTPRPANFIPLEFPNRRPTAQQAAPFLGRWVTVAQADTHEVVIRVDGDTIVVHDRLQMRGSDWFEADDPVIQVTSGGMLEWGLPFFRGLAALVVLKARIDADGAMVVTREVRGWVPRGPGADLTRTERFRKTT